MTPLELLRQGGAWLGAARDWIKWHVRNGDRVTWGSDDVLEGGPWTVARAEDLAAHVAAAALGEVERLRTDRDVAVARARALEAHLSVGRQMATVIYNVTQTGDWERAKQPLIELRQAWDRLNPKKEG